MTMYMYNGKEDFYIYDVLFAKPGATIAIEEKSVMNLSTRVSITNVDSIVMQNLMDNLVRFESDNEDFDRPAVDNVNHPSHYTSHPSGVECINITRHYCFAVGNAIKYLWRAGLKRDASMDGAQKEIEDLKKARWYINDRIAQLEEIYQGSQASKKS